MNWKSPYRHVITAALGVCLCLGCSTTARRSGTPASDPLALTPAEDDRARALAHYATAIAHAANNDLPSAMIEYRAAFELDPANSTLAMWLAEVYRSRQDLTNAFAVLDTAIKNAPSAAEPWLAKGLIHRGNDDLPAAITSLRQAQKLEPMHIGVIRALTETYLAIPDTNSVVILLDQAFRQKSTEASYWIVLGDLHTTVLRQSPSLAGRLDRTRARQCYDHAKKLSPHDPEILARLGDSAMDANDFKAAAEAYGKLLEIRPNVPNLRERLAAIYLRTGQGDKAIELYKELIKREPLRFEFYNVLGELEEDAKRLEAALGYYEQSLKLNPDQSELYLATAELQRRLKQPTAVTETLATWKKKFPTDWRIPYFTTFLATEKKDYAQALAGFADAATLAREAPQEVNLGAQFYFGYGAAYERTGDLDNAAAMFRKALELNPQFAGAHNYLGYMWADKGLHLTEALTHIQKAVELDPDNGAYLDSLGWVKFKLGRVEEALPHLQRAIELLENDKDRPPEDRLEDAVVYDHLAEVQLRLGRIADAIQTWKRALALDPGNKEIAAKLQQHSPVPP
ncbi:MAG: Beta-barrel assembly-enhancing protease [Verrucomicrobiae bacterium]|nr:Beta-barrel assembly-enhancing protease [Verrucomicrobiae bacterium]